MKVQIQKLNQSQLQGNSNFYRSELFLRRWRGRLHDQLLSCKCYHMYCGHRLGVGKCDYDNCLCKEFKAIEVVFIVKIYEEIKIEKYEGGLF